MERCILVRCSKCRGRVHKAGTDFQYRFFSIFCRASPARQSTTQQRTTTRSNPIQNTCYRRKTPHKDTATTVRAPLLTFPRFTPCGRLVKRMPTRRKPHKQTKMTNEQQKHTRTPTENHDPNYNEKRTHTTMTKKTKASNSTKTRVKSITEPRKTSKKTSKTHKTCLQKPVCGLSSCWHGL